MRLRGESGSWGASIALLNPKASVPALAVYGLSVFAANWLIRNWGTVTLPDATHLVPVGFGLLAPSGAYAAGVTFIARDVVQRTTGRLWSLIVIVPGVILTAVMSPRLAVASAAAFMLSELIDFGVFTPLQNRGLVLAVFVSGIVASAVDSLTFLELAGIPLEAALLGLLLAKFWVQLIATPLTQLLRRSLPAVATAR